MRDYKVEFEKRVEFIRNLLQKSGCSGIVYGNSGGKDSALVGILCKAACDNTVGILMPCSSQQNYGSDIEDGKAVAERYSIETRLVDLAPVREAEIKALEAVGTLTPGAIANIAPRLRMTTLYAVAGSEGRLVAGTGNRSEAYVGYFTKWGDGAHDFNPIFDLTVTEIYEFLRAINAPACVIDKAPSAALFDGQTDEGEMGIKYSELDEYIMTGRGDPEKIAKIERLHHNSQHKRDEIKRFVRR